MGAVLDRAVDRHHARRFDPRVAEQSSGLFGAQALQLATLHADTVDTGRCRHRHVGGEIAAAQHGLAHAEGPRSRHGTASLVLSLPSKEGVT